MDGPTAAGARAGLLPAATSGTVTAMHRPLLGTTFVRFLALAWTAVALLQPAGEVARQAWRLERVRALVQHLAADSLPGAEHVQRRHKRPRTPTLSLPVAPSAGVRLQSPSAPLAIGLASTPPAWNDPAVRRAATRLLSAHASLAQQGPRARLWLLHDTLLI